MADLSTGLRGRGEEWQSRADHTFNGNYGLNRGLAAACVALAMVAATQAQWYVVIGFLALAIVFAYRAYRFGVHYARELYLQFLVL